MHANASTTSTGVRPNFCRTPKHTVGLVSERVHRVEVRHGDGSQTVEDLTASFATELCAALVQRIIAGCLRADLDVDATREVLVDRLAGEIASEVRAPYKDAGYIADMIRAMKVFTPRADLDRLDEKAAELVASFQAGVR